MAEGLDEYNSERKAIEAQVQEEAFQQLEHLDPSSPLTLAVGRDWHAGVIGIVASRLKDKTRRPSLVISLSDGVGKGSGRSVLGIDLGAAVTAARQAGLLINGGGHAMAAGLTVAEDQIEALASFLSERLGDQAAARVDGDSLGIDGALSVSGASLDLLEVLAQAGPYGAGNPEPRFVIPSARLAMVDVVGKDHVRCQLTDAGGGRLKGIAFRCADTPLGQALLTHSGRPLHIAGHLRADYWRGEQRLQLTIEDAAPAVEF
jgi:single-stranded-DNA-specific exonuclease